MEHRADLLDDLIVAHQLDVHHLGERCASDVVLGGPESAADDQRVGASERRSKGEHDAFVVVAHVLMEVRSDAVRRQVLAEPLGVGIGNLAEQQFGADGDDLNSHARRPFDHRRSSASRCRPSSPQPPRS